MPSTRQHESSRTRASSTGDSLISGEVSYTGWTLSTGFGSESASRCSDVCTRWLLNTCRPTPAFLVDATCDRLTVVISTSHMWNLLRTEGVYLHTPTRQTGTHFLLTLETIAFLCHLLGATSKPFSSLSTRLAHAARLGFFLQKRAIKIHCYYYCYYCYYHWRCTIVAVWQSVQHLRSRGREFQSHSQLLHQRQLSVPSLRVG